MEECLEDLKNDILEGVQRLINTANLHQKTFKEFKNIFYGKKVVLVGAGPTLNYFEPIEDAIYVGVNRTFLNEKIKFDYLFTIDRAGLDTVDKNYLESFLKYKGNNCIKFIGEQNLGIDYQIPEGCIIGENIRRYKTSAHLCRYRFTLDIDSEPLGNFASVGLQAIQFIMYGNPKEVYFVGFDCNALQAGHFTGGKNIAFFRNENLENTNDRAISQWKELKIFRNTYYPDTKFISVNPVGLRNVFDEDIYTDNYKDSEARKKYEKTFDDAVEEKYSKFLKEIDFDSRYEKLLEELKDKKIILYGAGEFFEFLNKRYDFNKLNIIGISDKRFTRQDKEFLGYKAIKVSNIINEEPDVVLLTLFNYEPVMSYLKTNFFEETDIRLVPICGEEEKQEKMSYEIKLDEQGTRKFETLYRYLIYTKEFLKNIIKYRNKKIYMQKLQIWTGQTCTLKCKNCSQLFPYIKPKLYNVDKVIGDAKKILKYSDVNAIHIIGGEPFTNKDIAKLIEFIAKVNPKKPNKIITNGTIIPQSSVLEIMQKYKDDIYVTVSDYPHISKQQKKFKETLERYNIRCSIVNGVKKWFYCGNNTQEEIKDANAIYRNFDACWDRSCYTIADGKLSICPRMHNSPQVFHKEKQMFIEHLPIKILGKINPFSKALIATSLSAKTYREACKHCLGVSKINNLFCERGEQITKEK